MRVSTDPDYLNARAANLATYEAERDLAIRKNEKGEYKEGEFERVRDVQRHNYTIAMSHAYAEFLQRETRQAIAAAQAAG
ncbi:MAG TPA: hypothetical protein VFA81_11015 [Burkholderiales bacterium]|nr:hypothetical protein [Burkholderiales bacterium]